MGRYNPRAPYIVGEEWVPIRNENTQFVASTSVAEIGHMFTLSAPGQVSEGRFYTNTVFSDAVRYMNISVYPAGQEALTGPVKSCVIPVNNGSITAGTQNTDWGYLFASTIPQALNFESLSGLYFNYYAAGPAQRFTAYFATNEYSFLQGKRIVGVNLLVEGYGYHRGENQYPDSALQTIQGGPTPVLFAQVYRLVGGANITSGDLITSLDTSGNKTLFTQRFSLGDHFDLWAGGTSSDVSSMPWTYADLQRFELSSSDPVGIRVTAQPLIDRDQVRIYYMALEVLYCEETRVATGASGAFFTYGMNPVKLRHPVSRATNPVLTAGDYYVTLSMADPGFAGVASGDKDLPYLNALRELYAIETHPGLQVNITRTEGETFSSEEIHVLTQLSLHASGGSPLTDVNSYGRQVAAEAYGSLRTPTQVIDDSVVSAGTQFPQVRFYARRWGDGTEPLVFNKTTDATRTATITTAEFDALDEVVDGWKEVTLRFTTSGGTYPTLGGSSFPSFKWSATGESLPGNRWEILGVTAPSISGGFGGVASRFLQVPSAGRLGTTTWGGTTAFATWSPGYLPPASGMTADTLTDLVVIFSQDPPSISGFTVTEQTQELVGIGLDCGLDPCGMPTGVYYNLVSWTAVADQEFGYYELQRKDTVDTGWQTIMQGSAVTGTSFNDYEARVGVASTYRMRVVNSLEFAGSWSSEVSITPTTPGITGGACALAGHVLIFTTNERQDGSGNLAYASVWDAGRVTEEFTFPEAGWTQFQTMYNRDFHVAFRPLERGGAQFTRTVLVQAAAISTPTLPGFQSLSDMAWDSVSYVCVRDEDGNRWLANVLVPGGRVQRNRRLYMAPVTITEVTDTASPVDPWS